MTTTNISESKLLTTSSYKIQLSNNFQIKFGFGFDYYTAIMYLEPSTQSGKNLCAYSSAGCATACLVTSGRMNMAKQARRNRTEAFNKDKQAFKIQLFAEIEAHIKKAHRKGLKPAIRLNGTSDIPWELVYPDMMSKFSDVQFYDYTKYPINKRTRIPANYDLTFSRSEENHEQVIPNLEAGRRVAVVFDVKRNDPLPATYLDYPVIDGDLHDMRFLDSKGVIIGLHGKGLASKDETGFVVAVA